MNRKLFRDIWRLKGQMIAIMMVLAAGVTLFVLTMSNYESLVVSRDRYYERNRFADVFAGCKRAPRSLLDKIAAIDGVQHAEGRILQEVTLDVPGLSDPATGRLVSLPPNPASGLNKPYLRAGRFPRLGVDDEILAGEVFMEAHGFQIGTRINAVINGRAKSLHIVGTALSPEFIYVLKPGTLFPDNLRYGVFWMNEDSLEASLNMEGAFNDVTLKLARDGSADEVVFQLDELLEPYGGVRAIKRRDQASHWYLENEMQQLRSAGWFIPVMFFGVAVFLLNLVIARLIRAQREQIAVLKAFGYASSEIGFHYLKFVVVVVLLGNLVGIAMGAYLGSGLVKVYGTLYKFPELTFLLSARTLILGVLVSGLSSCLGTLSTVRRAVLLPPAEAMKPEPPANYRPTFLERLGLGRFMSVQMQMIMRNMERAPLRTFLSCVGIAMATGLLVLGRVNVDALNSLIRVQFETIQREDMMVTFYEPNNYRAFYELQQLPGVAVAEPLRSVGVNMVFGQHEKQLSLQGVHHVPRLRRYLGKDMSPISMAPEGLMLDRFTAEKYGIRPGHTLTLEVLEGSRPVIRMPVVGLVEELIGGGAYINMARLHEVLGEDRTVNGAYLLVDEPHWDSVLHRLKETPKVAGVTIADAALKGFMDTIAQSLLIMNLFNIIFAGIIAFGVVYNAAQMSVGERSRDLATLRVLGFSRAEISDILLGELALVTLAAIPFGLVLGTLMAHGAIADLQTEQFRIPFALSTRSYAVAVLVVLLSALISGLVVRRRLDKLDLMAVLKTRE
nr:FtsX-like permease family protein [Acanthopleuribacter pedis]